MAITTGTWNLITFKPFTDVAWTGLTPPYPSLNGVFLESIIGGTDLMGYIIADGDPFTFAVVGGIATFPASVVAAEAVQTSVTVTDNNGTQTSISRSPDGSLSLWIEVGSSLVTTYDSSNTADINTITS